MVKKTYSEANGSWQVTFELPPEVNAQSACLCGEFNEWDRASQPMQRHEDGSFALTLSLQPDRPYRFRYLLDGERWENDWAADAYVPNPFGSEDSVVQL